MTIRDARIRTLPLAAAIAALSFGVNADAQEREIVTTIDLYGSLAALTGAELPEDAALDTANVMNAMLGKENAKGREEFVEQDNGNSGNLGFRSGNWKLQRHEKGKARNVVVEQELANVEVPVYQLFNLEQDPGEKENVIKSHPEIAERLTVRLDEIIAAGRSRN